MAIAKQDRFNKKTIPQEIMTTTFFSKIKLMIMFNHQKTDWFIL